MRFLRAALLIVLCGCAHTQGASAPSGKHGWSTPCAAYTANLSDCRDGYVKT